MASVPPLAAESLRTPCTLEAVRFTTTADLPGLGADIGVPGQERARDAVKFGVGLRAPG